jgi:serine/threonine-protein kinase RsbW
VTKLPESLDATLAVSAVLENLHAIRSFVDLQARQAGFEGQRVDDLVLAVDEAATNIIVHGYAAHTDGASLPVEVEVRFRDPILSVILRDQARPFDPTAAPVIDELPPLTERGPGGLGIFLIRKTMDDFRYRRTEDGWNELTLSISRRPGRQEDSL